MLPLIEGRFAKQCLLLSCAILPMTIMCVPSANADPSSSLVALRATLQNLNADTEIRGKLDVELIKSAPKQDDDKGKASGQKPPIQIQLQVTAGNGLGIHLAPELLQQISAEQQAHAGDPEQPTPRTDLLSQVGPMDVEQIVSAAPGLLHKLDGAESPLLKGVQYEGMPAQELSVKLPLKASKKDSSNISDYQGGMTLWLNAKGVPLAYEQTFHAKFCKFFLCVSVDETRNARLQAINGRLVAVSYSDETRQSGLGQDGDSKQIYTLTLDGLPEAASN